MTSVQDIGKKATAGQSTLPPLPSPPTLKDGENYSLTEDQKDFFLENGYIKLSNCFSREQAAAFTSQLWDRLDADPNDKSTWPKDTDRINMPFHNFINVQDFAPRAWAGMCELLGGEERIGEGLGFKGAWSDAFIVNFGKEEFSVDDDPGFRDLDGWHNDGDFFVHFLDSPEQGLLVIPLWSDIQPLGGGTVICPDGIAHVAKHMYDHPEGTTPWMTSIETNDPAQMEYEGRAFWKEVVTNRTKTPRDSSFVEATGQIGDVYLLHPLMLHSATNNLRRDIRVITNPPVSLAEPFKFYRGEGEGEYSLVERKTLKDLGKKEGEGLKGWKIKGERKGWVSQRMKRWDAMKKAEEDNLKKVKAA